MKKAAFIHLSIFGMLLLLDFTAQAALGAPAEIAYEEVLETALESSTFVKAIAAQSAATKAEAVQLKTLSNPELAGEFRQYTTQENNLDDEYEISLTQPLRLSSFGVRQRLSELIEKSTVLSNKLELLEFSGNLQLIYAKAWALQEKEKLAQDLVARTRSLAEIIQRANLQGLLPGSISQLFLAEIEKQNAELIGITADRNRAKAELIKRSGVDYKTRLLKSINLPPLPDLDGGLDTANLPLADAKKLRLKIAATQRELAALDAFPKFAPKIAFEHTADGDDRINFGLQIDLPIFDRNQAAKLKSKAEEEFHESEVQQIDQGNFHAEVSLVFRALEASTQQAKLYKEKVLPALEAALKAATDELRAGQGNPQQVLQNLIELRAAQDMYLQLVIKSLSERVELSIMTGKEI
ncbi:TolC family protein [bacterium]|nr:TolC family protein [bacterium]